METRDEKDLRIEELENKLNEANEQIKNMKYEIKDLNERNLRLRVKNDIFGAIIRGIVEEI